MSVYSKFSFLVVLALLSCGERKPATLASAKTPKEMYDHTEAALKANRLGRTLKPIENVNLNKGPIFQLGKLVTREAVGTVTCKLFRSEGPAALDETLPANTSFVLGMIGSGGDALSPFVAFHVGLTDTARANRMFHMLCRHAEAAQITGQAVLDAISDYLELP